MSDSIPKPEDQMMQWITSKWITKPIHVATELGIADLLQNGPASIDTLAKKTDTHAPTLYRLLRALTAVGVFVETKEHMFELTPLAQCLLSNGLRPLAQMFLSDWHDKAWNRLADTVRTGNPSFDLAFGKPAFQWIEENTEMRTVFDRAQGMKAMGFAKAVMEVYDFSPFRSICDVGGGQGAFLMQILSNYPGIEGVIADLPGVIRSMKKVIADTGPGTRCKAISHDFLKVAPPVCDGYFLVNVLHDWDDEKCCRILKNISHAMTADSKLWVVEYLLEAGPGFSVAKLLDLEVLVMGGGRERSIGEYATLLNSAGLKVSKVFPTNEGPAIIECVL